MFGLLLLLLLVRAQGRGRKHARTANIGLATSDGVGRDDQFTYPFSTGTYPKLLKVGILYKLFITVHESSNFIASIMSLHCLRNNITLASSPRHSHC